MPSQAAACDMQRQRRLRVHYNHVAPSTEKDKKEGFELSRIPGFSPKQLMKDDLALTKISETIHSLEKF